MPRSGSYACVAGAKFAFRWYLTINSDGTYQQRTPDLQAGHFQYFANTSAFVFDDGPYYGNGWFGRFSVEADGRHQIVLRSIQNEEQGSRYREYENVYCSNEG